MGVVVGGDRHEGVAPVAESGDFDEGVAVGWILRSLALGEKEIPRDAEAKPVIVHSDTHIFDESEEVVPVVMVGLELASHLGTHEKPEHHRDVRHRLHFDPKTSGIAISLDQQEGRCREGQFDALWGRNKLYRITGAGISHQII